MDEREEIIKKIKDLGIVCVHEPDYNNMSLEILKLRLKIFQTMFEDYFEDN